MQKKAKEKSICISLFFDDNVDSAAGAKDKYLENAIVVLENRKQHLLMMPKQ